MSHISYVVAASYYARHTLPSKLLTTKRGRQVLRDWVKEVGAGPVARLVARGLVRQFGVAIARFDLLDRQDYWDEDLGHLWSFKRVVDGEPVGMFNAIMESRERFRRWFPRSRMHDFKTPGGDHITNTVFKHQIGRDVKDLIAQGPPADFTADIPTRSNPNTWVNTLISE